MPPFVYMLRCSDKSYYVGSTRATLERRVDLVSLFGAGARNMIENASWFETLAALAPHHEEVLLFFLILRRPRSGRLEG